MKTTTFFLLNLLFSTLAWAQGNALQGKIETAFANSFAVQQNQLAPIISELKADRAGNAYWIAYGQFYNSLYNLQTGQKEAAAKAVAEAIALLESTKTKSSEEHALLGYLLGYSIAFDESAAGRLAAKAAGEYQSALKKDANNMRAYVGLGISDFQRPAAYGGGKKAEEYLLKALSLPEQSVAGGPSWGKNLAYHTLASFYQREGQTDKAKMYCMQGLSKYPNDFQLNQLKQSL